MNYIKNIEHEKTIQLTTQISAQQGQVVSKTLAQNQNVSITLFAFSKGEEISTHESKGDAMVTVLEGTGKFIIDKNEFELKEGQTIIMPANKPHSVHATENFKMILTVIFPASEQ
ncbi:MAG: cupin domain-containing protein [Clostridia bacterium]